MEEFELKGKWWLPESPERRIHGILKYNVTKGTELKLDGLLLPPNEAFATENISIINGEAYGNKTISLLDNIMQGINFVSGGLSTSNYYANKLLIGGTHLNIKDPKYFKSISTFSNLLEWMRVEWFYFKNVNNNIETKEPETINIIYDNEIQIDLKRDYSKESSYSNLSLSTDLYFKVKNNTAESIEHFQKYIFAFQNLSTLISQFPITEKTTQFFPNEGKFPYYFLYQPKILDPTDYDFIPDFFIRYNHISDEIPNIYRKWINIVKNNYEIIDLYFTTVYNKNLSFTYKFLHLVQALEVYYSSFFNNKYLPDSQFKNDFLPLFIQNIPAGIDNDFKQSIKQRFNFLHYHSLRKALKEVVNKVKEFYPTIDGFNDTFIEDVVNSRNYLVHRSKDLYEIAKHNLDLFELTQRIYFLITFCFLIDLEIDKGLVLNSALQLKKFKHYFSE